jgi:hypothetical protein
MMRFAKSIETVVRKTVRNHDEAYMEVSKPILLLKKKVEEKSFWMNFYWTHKCIWRSANK